MKTKSRSADNVGKSGGRSSGGKGKGLAKKNEPSGGALPEFLDLTPFDRHSQCPKLCALLEMDEGEPVASEDLDPIQQELEKVLLNNVYRQKAFVEQLDELTDGDHLCSSLLAQEREKAKSSPAPVVLKRADDAPSKMRKIPKQSGSLVPTTSESSKGFAPVPLTDNLGRRRIFFWPQNHMPDKFWLFVSEYCDQVLPDDLKTIKVFRTENSEEKNIRFNRVPGLGKHYSLRWSEEGQKGKQLRRKSGKRKRASDASEGDSSDTERRPRKSRRPEATGNGISALGPLTERLVQALLEEGASGNGLHLQTKLVDAPDCGNGVASPNKALAKSLHLGNMAALERRIKKELEEQGLLDNDDDSDDGPSSSSSGEDEVSLELRQRQEELGRMLEKNREGLGRLETLAETAVRRQQLHLRLREVDDQLLNLYNRFYQSVPKRRPSSKKERDQLTSVLDQRHKIFAQLDQLQT